MAMLIDLRKTPKMLGKPVTQYLNTDLDLVSNVPLADLAAELQTLGVFVHVTAGEDGLHYAICEVSNDIAPEPNIVQLLDALDQLSPRSRETLRSCKKFEFNMGYDCGDEPWGFTQGISSATLSRLAVLGAGLWITLYPVHFEGRNRSENKAAPES